MKPFAVFDISSSSVAGAHALTAGRKGTSKTTILASARIDLALQEDLNIERFVSETANHLSEVVATIQQQDSHHPEYIQVILASPWYSSQTRTISYKKNAPFTCTQKLVDSLVDKEIEHVLRNEEGSFGSFGDESLIVEKQLSLVKLNGYTTTDPFGKKAEQLEIVLTLTVAPKPVLDRFTDVLRRAYGTRKIGYTTGAFTTYIVARDTISIQDECVVVDVGEEVTDVAFIKDGFLLYQHSFPCGTYALYRALASHSNRDLHETRAVLEAYRLRTLAAKPTKAVEKSFTSFAEEWQKGLHGVLDSGQYGFKLPKQWIITADPRFEAFLVDLVTTDPFIAHISSVPKINAVFFNGVLINSALNIPHDIKIDAPICVGALFVERLL